VVLYPSFGKIQDGGGRHLGLFLAIFQLPIKLFAFSLGLVGTDHPRVTWDAMSHFW